uniref:Uncharacterized protein n=1 Tax=Pundamilia nyererei TaxID=303518 RepID=A0A3B4FDN8_9CICH
MAEDHGLSDGDGAVDVRESLEFFFFAVTQHIVLFNGVQCFLLSLQLDYVGIRHNALVKHKHLNFLGINKLEFTAPVQHGTRCANNYLDSVSLMSSYHYLKDTHGSASIIGKAVSWIFDGRLKPIPYTP